MPIVLDEEHPQAVEFRDAVMIAPPSDRSLYRGMIFEWTEDVVPGAVVSFDRIGSFTDQEMHAEMFGEHTVRIPKGSPALPVKPIANTDENEWLVAGDWKVTAVDWELGVCRRRVARRHVRRNDRSGR